MPSRWRTISMRARFDLVEPGSLGGADVLQELRAARLEVPGSGVSAADRVDEPARPGWTSMVLIGTSAGLPTSWWDTHVSRTFTRRW